MPKEFIYRCPRPINHSSEVSLRNRLGIFLVVSYFGHVIVSVAYAATLADTKAQSLWLTVPLSLTPNLVFELLPKISGPQSLETWRLQTLIKYPLGMAFASVELALAGWVLQRIWQVNFVFGLLVGGGIGLGFGGLWYLFTSAKSPSWFALGIVGMLFTLLTHPNRGPAVRQVD